MGEETIHACPRSGINACLCRIGHGALPRYICSALVKSYARPIVGGWRGTKGDRRPTSLPLSIVVQRSRKEYVGGALATAAAPSAEPLLPAPRTNT